MATWAYVAKFLGIYTSPVFEFSLDGDGAISKIEWSDDVPEGTQLTIQTSISHDSGVTWGDWLTATNGGTIPHITEDMSMYNIQMRFRALLKTDNANRTPVLHSVDFEIEPIINFKNEGDKDIFPEVFIEKVGDGDISIINTSYGNNETKLVGLIHGEEIYLNGDHQQIETSIPLVYRYDNFNDNYLKMLQGENVLRVKGNGKIRFRYELKYLHGF